jgi:hypothetical protein
MIFGLRRYDVDRCAALIDMSDPANANVKVVGYMSHKSKIYLVSRLLNPYILVYLMHDHRPMYTTISTTS